MSHAKIKSRKVTNVILKEYSYFTSSAVFQELNKLVNSDRAKEKERHVGINADRCTVIISVPKVWGASLSEHPGHSGIALWNSNNLEYQSFGIYDDGTFGSENVNVNQDTLKEDPKFKIWYFTKVIDINTYNKLRGRMEELDSKKVGYGKFFVARGCFQEGSYSCVTAIDTILVAGGLSSAIGSLSSSPYLYAQTFSSAFWHISEADNMKHM